MTDRIGQIVAYVDGELDAEARLAFEAEMAVDPAMAAAVADHRALAARIDAVYAPVAGEPVPLALTLAAQAANDAPRGRTGLAWAGMAATLVVGVLTGRFVLAPEAPPSVGATLPARGEVARALEGQLAAQPSVVRVGLTFRDREGRWCRTFQVERDALAGLACRDDGGWRLETATTFAPGQAPAYRTAASETPPEVLAAVDRAMAGEVADAIQEKAARDGGWR